MRKSGSELKEPKFRNLESERVGTRAQLLTPFNRWAISGILGECPHTPASVVIPGQGCRLLEGVLWEASLSAKNSWEKRSNHSLTSNCVLASVRLQGDSSGNSLWKSGERQRLYNPQISLGRTLGPGPGRV